jgi:GTPase Era involved in 16S rRNA processing
MNNHPKFAVVGHPNKGKSSIVSSLALDDTIQISDTPGTTTKKRSFPLKVDGKIIYELFDTPGFQRARLVLAWLEKHDVSADKKHEVVQSFIENFRDDPKFNDEVELLEPIVNGASIIYVVDASKPYGKEYEAEMEILRWTGQPSMALINHIDDEDYTQEWKRALTHYFKIIRTYNPMSVSLAQHISILESMAQLKEEWTDDVKSSIEFFKLYHHNMLKQNSSAIAKVISDALSKEEKLYFNSELPTQSQKDKLEESYKNSLRELENSTQKHIEHIWKHNHLEIKQKHIIFDDIDLFSKKSASIFGLTKNEILLTAVGSGAATGAGIDLMFAGSTFLLGSTIGALVGGAGAFFAFNELSKIKILGHTLGKQYLQMGPMENRNFPYILLGRLVYHSQKVANYSHAKRDILEFDMGKEFKDKWLNDELRKELEKYHKIFRTSQKIDSKIVKEYEELITTILEKLIT